MRLSSTPKPVHADDRVELVGTVVRMRGAGSVGVGLAYDAGPGPVFPEHEYSPMPVVVPVVGPSGHGATWEELIGRRLRARGAWTGAGIICDPETGDVRPLAPLPPVERVRASQPFVQASNPSAAEDAERELIASGDIIWRVPFHRDGKPIVLVAAHDALTVERVLRPTRGQALHVVQSPWSREDYRRADAFGDHAEAQGVLISVEQGLDLEDGIVRYVITLTVLSDELAQEFATIPVGLARLTTLVSPLVP